MTTRRFDVRLWLALTEASTVASVLVLPYALDLQREALEKLNAQRRAAGKPPVAATRIALLTALQAQLTFGLVTAAGLTAARRTGLGAPHLASWLAGRRSPIATRDVLVYLGAGAGAGTTAAAADLAFFRGTRRRLEQRGIRPPSAWRGALAVPYGAIAEEVLLRLGVQSVLTAALARLSGDRSRPPAPATVPAAIAGSSLLFGAGHLPVVRAMGALDRPMIARTLVVNGLPGVVFGWLYWRRGLEASMIAHGATATLLSVMLPLVQRAGQPPHRTTASAEARQSASSL